MKRQYLGDSKDSFKWDYLHFLMDDIGYRDLKIAWMMTPDDKSLDGKTPPESFNARAEIISFCNRIKSDRNPILLSDLPSTTNATYSVSFHKPDHYFDKVSRNSYFSDIILQTDQLLFLDPDNGFEPERNFTEKHLRYLEIEKILGAAAPNSVAIVFQHHRRKIFRKTSPAFVSALKLNTPRQFTGTH